MTPLWILRTAFRTVGAVAPGVAGRWAENIFCRPPRNEPRPLEEAFLATGTRHTVQSEKQDIAVWVWSDGLAQALVASGFRVVLFDAPAHGVSMGRLASLPQFSRALRVVSDALGPVHGLVGHSLGGAAVSLAMRNGLQARRAVLLAAPADVVLFSRAFAKHLRIPRRAHNAMRQNLESRLQFRWEELHVPTLARRMTAPALIVHDRDDPDVPYAHGEEIAAAWPGAELMTTSGLGHRTVLRDPQVIERTVAFLSAGLAK